MFYNIFLVLPLRRTFLVSKEKNSFKNKKSRILEKNSSNFWKIIFFDAVSTYIRMFLAILTTKYQPYLTWPLKFYVWHGPNISESRHHSTTKISQNNLLHVNLPFCIKNALYFMPTAWIGLIGLKYEISLIFYRGVREPPNFYRTFTYHWAYDILHEKSIYCLNRPNWLEIPISCYL